MALFTYTATDINGRTIHGKESADDKSALIRKLRDRGLFCTSYTQEDEKTKDAKYKFKTKDLTFIARQISTMLNAGISLVRTLSILVSQQQNKKAKAVLTEVYDDVQRGKSFSEAMASQGNAFPPLFVSMVAAGEASGNLDAIMARLSSHYDSENKTHNKVRSAMTYPIILGIIMVAIVLILFVFVMPQFRDMFANPDEIPALTQFFFGLSDSMVNQWYIWVGCIVGIVLLIRTLKKVPVIKLWWDKTKCTMPKVGKLITTIYTSRFAHTMSNLFASGMQMVECIQKSVQVLNNSYITKQFDSVVESVKQGEAFSVAVGRTGVFDPVFTSIVYVGEESGDLDNILEKTADFYDDEADTAINKLTNMLQPLMVVIMGVIVCIVLLAVYPAMYEAMGSAGQ